MAAVLITIAATLLSLQALRRMSFGTEGSGSNAVEKALASVYWLSASSSGASSSVDVGAETLASVTAFA